MRKFNRIVLVLVLVIGLPYYWLLLDNRPGDVPAKPVTIEQLRTLAEAMPGTKPGAVEVELVAFGRAPGNLSVAGAGLKRQLIGVMAFRLPVSSSGPILIDSGITSSGADDLMMERFDAVAQQRVDKALRSASTILLTHEHIDHEGGVVALGDANLLGRVRFNAAQLPGNLLTTKMLWPQSPAPHASISGSVPLAIAPGVVVIPSPSHTPGSQMIYVHLADGREFLFTGDIATMAQSWRELRARSRLLSQVIGEEDRREVYAWLKTIRALHTAAPKMQIIAGHDYEWIVHDPDKRGVRDGFSVANSSPAI
jgi:glyoxylase-like metal-dependent hydrolase (beta-lactamase superfamily II)